MISVFRNATAPVKILLWFVIATFIGSIFVVWGIQSGDKRTSSYVVRVNDIEIGHNEFNRTYNQVYQNVSALFGDQAGPELNEQVREIVIDNLISKALLLEEAKRRGMRVSDQELFNSIAAIDAFRQDGSFDRNLYRSVLEANQLSPAIFEDMQKESLLVEKVQNQLISEVNITEDDLMEEYQWQHGKVAFDYIMLFPELFTSKIDPDDDELRAFYEDNSRQYMTPKSIQISYVKIPYNPQQTNDEEEVRQILQELRTMVRQGGVDFADASAEMDLPHVTSYIFDQDSVPEELINETRLVREAFIMPEGGLTNVIRGQDAMYLVKKEKDVEPMVVPFIEIRDQVLADYIQHQSYELSQQAANDLQGKDILEISVKTGAQIDGTDLIPYADRDQGPGFNQDLMLLAFHTEVGETAGPAEIISIPLFLKVTNKEYADESTFDEYRPELEAEVRQRRGNELLSEWLMESRQNARINVNKSLFAN
ncbi:peptidylprolyl isomerase [Desulfurispira natronophila]|uniref:Periplasmic chaperone PpiD n=1 Tax=Desulfurispira natronophila TaxID=682562 RepID=A0A7W7Y4J9_9BACT|nr:SurA N-terminal domain-containing protein [Desulfurispira natronophila]MBB5021687.1 peptidyl-prolyl cis-trans isomerase D [Desulfurispira natronophila]